MLSKIGMLSKIAPPLLTALVIAGCGGQTPQPTATTHARSPAWAAGQASPTTVHHVVRSTTGRSSAKATPAQRYLAQRMRKPEKDNEGPDKPVAGRAPVWSYHVVLLRGSQSASADALTAQVSLRGRRVCWEFPHAGASTRGGITAATIHVGPHGARGPEVVVFGPRFSPRGCIVVKSVVVNSIAAAPHFYYLQVVGPTYRGRGARAQL